MSITKDFETHNSLVSCFEKDFTFEKMKIQIDSVPKHFCVCSTLIKNGGRWCSLQLVWERIQNSLAKRQEMKENWIEKHVAV